MTKRFPRVGWRKEKCREWKVPDSSLLYFIRFHVSEGEDSDHSRLFSNEYIHNVKMLLKSFTMTAMMMTRRRLCLAWLLLLVSIFGPITAQDVDCTEECTKVADARVLESVKSCQEERHTQTKQMESLQVALEQAKENAKASLERANSLRREHDEALNLLQEKMENDLESCKNAQQELHDMRTQLEKLTLAEQQVADLKQQVATMAKEKNKVEKEKESLQTNLSETTDKLRVTTDKYLESSQALLKAKDQYQELYQEYSTTHINFKLIRDDFVKTFHKIRDSLYKFWEEKLAPYWIMIATPLAPWITFVIGIVGPVIRSTITLIVDLFHQQVVPLWNKHIVPLWNKHVYPKLEPTIQPLMEKHDEIVASLSTLVQQKCHDAYSYINLLKGKEDGPIRNAVLDALKYGDENSEKVVHIWENMLVLFIGFWILAGLFALRRHRKRKRAASAAAVQSQNQGGLAYANHARKKNQ